MSANWKDIVDYYLTDKFNGTQGPEYRGAPYPSFDPYKINEERIPDNMRSKWMAVRKIGESSDAIIYEMYYQTQEPFNSNDFSSFVEELERATTYIEDEIKKHYFIDKDVEVNCIVESRDGPSYGHEEGVVKIDKSDEPDVIIEDIENKDISIYYFGFKGGEAGSYFEGDFFEVYKDKDNKYHWQEESHNSGSKVFNSREEARDDAIKELTPDDGSEFLFDQDPDELFDRIFDI